MTRKVGGNAVEADYSFPYRVWLPINKRSVSVAVTLTDDALIEGTEDFSVCFAPTGNLAITYNVRENCATFVVRDSDFAIVSVTDGVARRTVAEGGKLELELKLDKKVERAVNIDVTASGGSAGSDDYTLSPSSISFTTSASETFKRTITLQTTGDNVVEGNENLNVQLALGSSSASLKDAILFEGRRVPVEITDDDSSVLTLDGPSGSVPEGSDATFTARLSNPVQESFGIDWFAEFSNISVAGWTNVSDFKAADIPLTGSLNFASKQTAATFTVSTADDAVVEGDEKYIVKMREVRTVGGLDRGTVFSEGRTVTISDEDQATVSLAPAAVTVTEGGAAALTVRLNAAAETEVKVSWSTSDGTAEAGTDYTAQAATTLTFARGETEKTITVQTIDNSDIDDPRNFNVELATVAGGRAALGTRTVPVTIEDDGDSNVYVSAPAAPVTEGGAADFTLRLSTAPTSNVSVGWWTEEGTAGSSDFTVYRQQGQQVTFAPGETEKTISVQTTDDEVWEDDETFSIVLSLLSHGYSLNADRATATIRDNEGATLSVSGPSESVAEGDAAEFTISLSEELPFDVSISWFAVPWSATTTINQDYTYIRASTTFTTGETEKTITVQTIEDTIVEPDEKIAVRFLNASSLPNRVKAGATVAVATIADDDSLTVSIAGGETPESRRGGNEGRRLWATLSQEAERAVTVTYATSDGTAKAGRDYTATSGTLVLSAGTSRDDFFVPVIDDSIDEPDETFTVTLSDPQPSGQVTLDEATATVTIVDNEDTPTVSLALASQGVPENGGSTTVMATLSGASSEAATVTVSATPVTPAVAADFTLSENRTLTIAAGATRSTGTVTLTAVDNDIDAANKQLTVSGSAGGGARRIEPAGQDADDLRGRRARGDLVRFQPGRQRRRQRHVHRSARHRTHGFGDGDAFEVVRRFRRDGQRRADVYHEQLGNGADGDGERGRGQRRRG